MQTIALRTFALLLAPVLFLGAFGVAMFALPGLGLRHALNRSRC